MNVEPGVTLLHYRVLRRLGAGGIGEVFEAEDTKLGRRVAIKVLQSKTADRPTAIERFRQEARALASFHNPGIVTIHAIEELDGQIFLVMERVEGVTLAERLRRGALPAEDLLDLALHVTAAMGVAHERGIVHRDLKPGNIMIGPDGKPKVLDFGLARLLQPLESEALTQDSDGLTQTGAAVGTWKYMAPEQIRGEPADARSDVFALGAVLYEAATGDRPFPGPTSAAIADAILRHQPPSLRELRPDLPASFTDLVHWCLEKKSEARPANARVMHDSLAGLLRVVERDSVSAAQRRSLTAATRPVVARGGRRFSARWILTAVLVLAIALAAVAGYRWLRRSTPVPTAVAVLPFANLTGNPELDHLARGIPAGLINRLAQVAGLEVLSRSESWGSTEKNEKKLSPEKLAGKLGVASLVEGQLRGQGKKLEVDVQLTDAGSGVVLWSESFSGSSDKIFDLQRQIAVRLTRVLAVPLSPAERRRMAKDPTSSLAAYSYDLRGEQSLADATDDQGLQIAASQFREALRRDSSFALAHAGLAETLVRLNQDHPDSALLAEASQHAHRALELDPALGPAQVALARVARAQGHPESAIKELKDVVASLSEPDEAYRELASAYQQMGDLKQAEESLRLAIASAPDYWLNWETLGTFLLRQGRYDEARKNLEHAASIAPKGIKWPELNLVTIELFHGHWQAAVDAFEKVGGGTRDPTVLSNMGTAYFYLGRFGKAEGLYRRAVNLDPANFQVRRNLGDVLLRLGKKQGAREQYSAALGLVEKRLEQTPKDHALLLWKALYAAKAGSCPEALATAAALTKKSAAVGESARFLAETYALCGKTERALAAIRAALASGITPQSLAPEPEFESLHGDPRFEKLVGRGHSTQ